MRSRNIKPGFFLNEILGTCDPMVSLTFAGLWCIADRDGILEDRPLRIKAELFPYRDATDINGYLTVLERDGFITRYSVAGKGYIQIENFAKHQSPHNTEKARGYPGKDKASQQVTSVTVTQPLSNGEITVPERSDSLIPDSLIPDSGFTDSCADKQHNTYPTQASGLHVSPAGERMPAATRRERCPYQEIVAAYHEALPDCRHVEILTEKRKTHVRARWENGLPDLDAWREYFAYVAKSKFLTGQIPPAPGKNKRFQVDFDWLINETNLVKVSEGKYHG